MFHVIIFFLSGRFFLLEALVTPLNSPFSASVLDGEIETTTIGNPHLF